MIARARRRQQLARYKNVQGREAWPPGCALRTGLLVLSCAAFVCTAVKTGSASEYVISDFEDNKPNAQSQQFTEPAWPKSAPEPEVSITDHDENQEPSSFSFEKFLGGVTQAALLRPDYKEPDYEEVDDRAVSSSDDPLVSEWSVGDEETLDFQPVTPRAVFGGDVCGIRHCPKWVLQADALFLWQNNIASRSLYLSNNPAGVSALDSNDVSPSIGVGPRLALFRNFNSYSAFEANYFIVPSLAGAASLPTSLRAYEQNDLNGFIYNDINDATVDTDSQIQSLELNYRRRRGFATLLAGFRYVQWTSTMQINDNFTAIPTPPSVPPQFNGSDAFTTTTGNELYGGQLGCDLMLWNRGQRIRVNGIGKAGVFFNQAFQRSSVTTTATAPPAGVFNPINETISQSIQRTSFFGEVGGNATVDLTNWLSWRVGYNVFWLSGVATPANQLSVATLNPLNGNVVRNGINTSGSVLLHGVNTGIEARW
ncbi:BBP7 family outer membrane beta-barrel protein [Pirellulales bacterium]|nr:BBP7 family outer membrane beta-barrel protein [Pirellulales bacterium]